QCLAMCPGVSRSLSTMLGGIVVGLNLKAAIEFSFLLGLITLSAATCYDAMKYGSLMVQEIGWTAIIVGTVAAWISAVLAVRWLVGYLQKHSLNIFGWYRIAAGIFMFALFFSGAQLIEDESVKVEQVPIPEGVKN
ncbi:MAG: undecaprenyl-diphosphate phosphatase, partial [Akkermansia sp.]